MSTEREVLIAAEGFTPGIGFYISGLEEVREQLRKAVCDLSNEQIGARAVADAQPIGALMLHIGEAEWWWIQCVIAGREMSDEDRRISHWDVLEDPDGFAAKGYSSQYCVDAIDVIRVRTLEYLKTLTDEDLVRIYSFEKRNKTIEISLRWALHHLTDHESQHKGQILMLKRLLG